MPAPSLLCPLCEFRTHVYLFLRHGAQVLRCANCGLVHLGPEASASSRTAHEALPQVVRPPLSSTTEKRAAEGYVATLKRLRTPQTGLLAVTAERHPFLAAAEAQGFSIEARLEIADVEREELRGGPYRGAVVLFQLEKASNPVRALERIHRALLPGAVLLLVTPSLDSWPARVLRSQWTEWLPENRYYFDAQTIQSACLRSGFTELRWATDWRPYTVDHVERRAAASAPSIFTRAVHAAAAIAPAGWRHRMHLQLPGSGIVVTARRTHLPPRPVLSVVMPVFNERRTFEQTLRAVLEKECPGVDKEVVIVESHSTDGTREMVRQYEGHPGVTVIFEDRPRGKGAAVRAGLQHATGTIVLIQDADSEYDVNDYDALLEPILSFRRAFVLGSRHLGSWKVRNFANQPAVSAFFNFGHVMFRTALNIIYRQKLNDPFTMYKVFRRDCLHGLKLECNRFDFDFELVIKLLRKGYVPLEIPVNYTSRSFHEGKKVTVLRDPLTWIRALVKYRFASIYDE